MLTWLSANLINIALIAVLAVIVTLLLRGMIRDRKAGACSCGGSCASCGACGGCRTCGSMSSAATDVRERNRTTQKSDQKCV